MPNEWRHKNSLPLKKFKRVQPASKVVATVFWGICGVFSVDFLPRGRTTNAQFYNNLLTNKIREAIHKNRQGKFTETLMLFHCSHSANLMMAPLSLLVWQIICHPPHNSDLAPSDLFTNVNLFSTFGYEPKK